jgi:hypothetical protein
LRRAAGRGLSRRRRTRPRRRRRRGGRARGGAGIGRGAAGVDHHVGGARERKLLAIAGAVAHQNLAAGGLNGVGQLLVACGGKSAGAGAVPHLDQDVKIASLRGPGRHGESGAEGQVVFVVAVDGRSVVHPVPGRAGGGRRDKGVAEGPGGRLVKKGRPVVDKIAVIGAEGRVGRERAQHGQRRAAAAAGLVVHGGHLARAKEGGLDPDVAHAGRRHRRGEAGQQQGGEKSGASKSGLHGQLIPVAWTFRVTQAVALTAMLPGFHQ